MEIINKKHKDITTNKSTCIKNFIKFHNDKQIYFSITAVRELGLSEGLFMHVVNDGDQWFIYFNTDPDGFALSQQQGKNTVDVFNMALIKLFLKRTSHSLPCKFGLQETANKKDGCRLIEILHHKPFE